MDLKIISDKDYSLLVAKYENIEQLTKNVGEIIKLFNNYSLDKLKTKSEENFLIDIDSDNLIEIFANGAYSKKDSKSQINNIYFDAIIKIKEILISKLSASKIIFVENPVLVNYSPLFSKNNSLVSKNIFLDPDHLDTWTLVKKNFINEENIEIISYAEIINPVNKSELINFFRTDSYLNYRNIDCIKFEIFSILELLHAKAYKVFVLDLDNTLWHGILREEGYENLIVGGVSTLGKFFYEFQNLIKWLKKMGVLIAISSKNNLEDVTMAFEHLNSPLCIDDFVSIKTNDQPKSFSIKEISNELNISLKDFVFIDDTLHERNEVINSIPEMSVLDLNCNHYGWFEVLIQDVRFKKTVLNASKRGESNRTEIYKKREERIALKPMINQKNAYNNWLVSLKQEIKAFHRKEPSKRGFELFERVNQFNSLARKLSKEYLHSMINSGYEIIEFTVLDRFSNDGTVAVVLIENKNKILILHDFLMSCRVFGRKIEFAIIDYIYAYTLKSSCKELIINFKVSESNKSSTEFLSSITIENKFQKDLFDFDHKLRIKK